MINPTDLTYYARRAEREAVIAVATLDERIAAIHEELSRRYSDRLLDGLGDPPPDC